MLSCTNKYALNISYFFIGFYRYELSCWNSYLVRMQYRKWLLSFVVLTIGHHLNQNTYHACNLPHFLWFGYISPTPDIYIYISDVGCTYISVSQKMWRNVCIVFWLKWCPIVNRASEGGTGCDPNKVIVIPLNPKPHVWMMAWNGLKYAVRRDWKEVSDWSAMM